jgi:L-ascorbate metabolism protein UlaG (beta-lactamase superfamily)
MKITYVSHACLVVETEDLRLAFDPWLDGAAYANQWHVFPRASDRTMVDNADVIVISHGHEDHPHEQTLRSLSKDKVLYYPYYWYGGTFAYLKELGFRQAVEAGSGKTYRLSPRTVATFIVNGQDSIIVIEDGDQVPVNCNDALHSSDVRLIDRYTSLVRDRWPKIDILFCGFGGASYFPNTFHCPGKDDVEMGLLREQLFVHNFCHIIDRLAPRLAVPFAADFVLLAPQQRWINTVRFPREEIPRYFDLHFRTADRAAPRFEIMYPGDCLAGTELERTSGYRPFLEHKSRPDLLEAQYPEPSSAFCKPAKSEQDIGRIARVLETHLRRECRRYARESVEGLCFAVRLLDLGPASCLNVELTGRTPRVTPSVSASGETIATIETMSDVLMNSLTTDWGGDTIIIGYACEINVQAAEHAKRARICAELLTRYPRPADYARRHLVRATRYLLQSLPAVKLRLATRLSGLTGKKPIISMSSDAWITGDAETIRRAGSLPVHTIHMAQDAGEIP